MSMIILNSASRFNITELVFFEIETPVTVSVVSELND